MLAVFMKKLFLTVSFTFLFIADKKIDIRLNSKQNPFIKNYNSRIDKTD